MYFLALAYRMPPCLSPVDAFVKSLGGFNLFGAWFDAYRRVTGDFAMFDNRVGISQHPVKTAIFAPVLYQAQPWLARLQCFPEVGKGFRRHVGMPDNIVRFADQFIAGKTTDFDKCGIRINNAPFHVGFRDQVLIFAYNNFYIGHRQVLAHTHSLYCCRRRWRLPLHEGLTGAKKTPLPDKCWQGR